MHTLGPSPGCAECPVELALRSLAGQVGTRSGQVVPLQGRWAVWGWGAGVTQACLYSAGSCNETCRSVP